MNYWRVLRNNPGFRMLWIGQVVSRLGDSLHMIAIVFYVYQLTGSAFDVGKVMLSFTIPTVIAPFLGVVIDRYDKRKIMMYSDLLRALLVLVIPFTKSMAIIYAVTFLLQLVNQFFSPSRKAFIPEIVAQGELLVSNSAFESVKTFMKLVGPALAGVLVAASGPAVSFYINCLSFLVSALCIMLIPRPAIREPDQFRVKAKFSSDAMEGFKSFIQNRHARMITTLSVFVALGIGANNALVVVFVERYLGAGPEEYGLLSTFLGFGLFLGSIAVSALRRPPNTLIPVSLLTAAVGYLVFANTRFLLLAFVMRVLLGIGIAVYNVASTTVLQDATEPTTRGRVLTISSALTDAGLMVGMTLASFLADRYSVSTVLTVSSGWLVIGFGLSLLEAIAGRRSEERLAG